MEASIYDYVVDELLSIQSDVRTELNEMFKKTKPFRQEPMSDREALVMYDELTPDKKQWLLQNFGAEAVLPYFSKMESLKEKYGAGNG